MSFAGVFAGTKWGLNLWLGSNMLPVVASHQGRYGRRFSPLLLMLAVFGLMTAVVALYAAASYASGVAEPPQELVAVMLIVVMASGPVHVYLHELGHLLAGAATRLQVTEVAVLAGPTTRVWVMGATRLRIGLWGKESHVRLAAPPDQPAVRARMLIVVLAGPGANLAVAAPCFAAAASADVGYVRGVWLAVALAAALGGVASLIPVRTRLGGEATDGLLLLRVLFRPQGLRTALVLEHLAWRGRHPKNRWRSFDDLRPAPPAASEDARID